MSTSSPTPLDDAIIQAVRYVRTLAGIKQAPDHPPEQMSDFPYVVGYAGGGSHEFGAVSDTGGDKIGLHTLVVELHIARKDLSNDVIAAMKYADSIPSLLMLKLVADNNWNGTIDTFNRISYTLGLLGWNGAETFGFRFRVEGVKIVSPIV